MRILTRSRRQWRYPIWVGLALCCAVSAATDVFAGGEIHPRSASCSPALTSGFSGDPNATYSGDYGGGDGGGGGGGGGAGAGAGEGKVLGGLMTMTRLVDGAVLGAAVTDSLRGLVTIQPCPGDLPVLLTLTGQAASMYYDEGTNELVPFPADRVLHALINTFDENVAVSPLTEGAYRYALNNFILNPNDVRFGRVALVSTGDVTGLTAAQVAAANSVVLSEVNRVQTAGLQLRTINSLPTPIDNASSATALPNNRYGVAATVLGGLARMGSDYISSNQKPAAFSTSEQFARDLTDGKLDGFALDGSPAAGAGSLSYDAVRFPIALNVGANAVANKFGAATTYTRSPNIAERTYMSELLDFQVCGQDSIDLIKDASITVNLTGCSGAHATNSNFATQVRLIEGSGIGAAPRTFFVKEDGTVWGWGEAACGLLGDGTLSPDFRSDPVQLSGISNVTSIAVGWWFTLARDSSGAVYSWGLNYDGELGLGNSPSGSSCTNDFAGSPDFRSGFAVATPTRISGITDAVTVSANLVTAFALDRSGNVLQWGLIPTGWDFSRSSQPGYHGNYYDQPIPAKVAGLPPIVSVATAYYTNMALAADGTVWGWGLNLDGNFGDGSLSPHLVPAQVPGLSRVAEIAANGNSPFVALLQDGTIRYWGGCCTGYDPSTQQPVQPPYVSTKPVEPPSGNTHLYSPSAGNYVGYLPLIRHVKGNGGAVLLYGVDGSLYQFPKSDTEQVFALIDSGTAINYEGLWMASPAFSESGWGIQFQHQGDTIFATWFTYDLNGKGRWLVMTAPKIAPNTYQGALYTTTGPPFSAVPFDANKVVATQVGTGTLAFIDGNNGNFTYTVNGIAQNKAITREVFGMLPSCSTVVGSLTSADNYQDLWWAAPASESGWGINLTHQSDIIFGTWYTYDLDSSPMWLTVTAPKSGPGVYSGALYRTTGPAFNSVPFNPNAVVATPVGTATFTISDGNNVSFAYTVNGVSQVKSLNRYVFANPGTVCY